MSAFISCVELQSAELHQSTKNQANYSHVLAAANIEQHGVGSVYSVSTGCVFEGVAAWPRASWLIANPPYLPAPDADIFMVGGKQDLLCVRGSVQIWLP